MAAADLDKLKLERERLTELKNNMEEKNKQMKEGKICWHMCNIRTGINLDRFIDFQIF